jgi:hypothetical protein
VRDQRETRRTSAHVFTGWRVSGWTRAGLGA